MEDFTHPLTEASHGVMNPGIPGEFLVYPSPSSGVRVHDLKNQSPCLIS